MASSPEFIRLATSSSRTLVDTALDSLRDAVVIVDARHKHFPVVLANAAARCCLIEESDTFGLIESPLYHWLAPESVTTLETSLVALPDHRSATRQFEWRCAAGETSVMTDIRPLVSAPGQRLIMLTFAPATPEQDLGLGLGANLERVPMTDARNMEGHRLLALTEHPRDITERKLAESRLAQREELFRLAADAVDGVIYEWDVTRGFVHRSRGVLEILGLESGDLESTISAWYARIHPRDFEVSKKAVNLGLLTGRGWTTTYRIRDSWGRYRSILERGLIQRNVGGDPVRAICCCVDVSEIKRVTDLLAETQRAAQMGGWEYSYVTRELSWTDEMYRIYEATPEEFPVSWDTMLGQCTPESLRRFHDARDHSEASGVELDLELEITTLKDQRIWVRVIGHVEFLDGRPFRAFGSVQNVQAKKLVQIAGDEHGLVEAVDEHGAHACVALGPGPGHAGVRHGGWSPARLAELVSGHEETHGASASGGSPGRERRHR